MAWADEALTLRETFKIMLVKYMLYWNAFETYLFMP